MADLKAIGEELAALNALFKNLHFYIDEVQDRIEALEEAYRARNAREPVKVKTRKV